MMRLLPSISPVVFSVSSVTLCEHELVTPCLRRMSLRVAGA
jgi:hypothetical protein